MLSWVAFCPSSLVVNMLPMVAISSPGTVGYNYGQDKTMKKNWKEIANIGNEQLRINLITCQGEVAEGLAKGFPKYFLAEGEEHPLPSRSEFLKLISEMDRRETVIGAVRDAGLPHQRFSFTGSKQGNTEGISYVESRYKTVRHGQLEYFFRSSKRQGEEVYYEGIKWVVVWNGYAAGAPEYPAAHSLVIVPIAAFAAI
jgi:hypothetical protein